MKAKEYFLKYGVKVAVILLVVVLLILIVGGVRSGLAGPIEDGSGAIKAPIQRAATAIAGWMESIYGYLYKYDQLVEENTALKAQVSELQEASREYAAVTEENKRLHELLNLQERHADFQYETAKVIAWDSSNYSSAFTIGKGSDSGIALGDSVITEYGALVGQVTELGTSWATVRTVIDVEMNVGALFGAYNYAGMMVGDFNLMQSGQTRLAYLSSGSQIFEGDEVFTSGSGGAFPYGLEIGTVSAVMTEAGGQTTYGVITPAADLDSLSQIFVITDYDIVN